MDQSDKDYKATEMCFSNALQAIKLGLKVASRSWDLIDKPYVSTLGAPGQISLILACNSGVIQFDWLPSVADLFVDDWYIVD